jgi:hypothetical protein
LIGHNDSAIAAETRLKVTAGLTEMRDAAIDPATISPLRETFTRLAKTNPYLSVTTGIPTDGEWTSLADLLDLSTGRFEAQWSVVSTWYTTDIPEVITRFLGGGIVYAVAGAAVGAFARDRRVPDLSPANVWLRFAEWGSPNAVAFSDDRFVGLPDDPAAGLTTIETVPTVEALRDLLREDLIATFAPFITLLRSRARIGARSLWQGAAESCGHAIIGAVPLTSAGDEHWLREEITALLCQPDSPLRAKPDLALIEANGRRRLFLIGSTCCENFKRPGEGYCNNCPHRQREERLDALREWVAELPA